MLLSASGTRGSFIAYVDFRYLNDVEEGGGGATWFPQASVNATNAVGGGGASDDAEAQQGTVESRFGPELYGMAELYSYCALPPPLRSRRNPANFAVPPMPAFIRLHILVFKAF